MNDIYLYFRTEATAANDDSDIDSVCVPFNSFTGMDSTSASGVNTVILYFKSLNNVADADGTGGRATDMVNIDLVSTATPKEFMQAFIEAVNTAKGKQKKFLVIGDDQTGTTDYFSKLISSLGAITIANTSAA
tara:strand:- start:2783 stop:3181 length:399 start_codon:yes stop_codon:yes gene_type:complete